MVPELWLQSDDFQSCEKLKKSVTDKYFPKKVRLYSKSPSVTVVE